MRTSRPYHHGNLRSALLERAERALAQRGAEGLSLRELARAAGVSHAAPRRHFADKQALLDALAKDGFARLGSALREALGSPEDGFLARFTALASAYVRFATEHAALLELMYATKRRPGADAVHAAAEGAFAGPLGLFTEAQVAGDVVGSEPESVATVAWATLHGIAAMANSGLLGHASVDAVVPAAVEQLVLGLRPR